MLASRSTWLRHGAEDAGGAAFAQMLRESAVVDWIYGSVFVLGLVVMTLNLTRPDAYAAPVVAAIVSGFFAATALVLRRLAIGRTSNAVVAFVLGIYGVIVLVSHFNGLGIRTPSLNLGPVLLFVTACIAPTRVAVAMGVTAFFLVLSLVPISSPAPSPHMPSLTAAALSSLLGLTLGGVLGLGIGRILRQTIADSAKAAQLHFQEVYSDQALRTLQAVMQASPYGIILSELPSGRIKLFNTAFARIIGRREDEITGHTGASLGAWADLAERDRVVARAVAGEPFEDVVTIRRPDGSTVAVQASAACVNVDGVRHFMMVGRDISEERRRQIELQAVMDTAEAAIVVVQKGRLTSVSRRYEEMMRIPHGSAVGQGAELDFGGLPQMLALHEFHAPTLRRGQVVRFEHTVHRPDGTTFEGRFTGRLIHPGARDGFSTVFLIEDITEQRAHERQLEKSREDALAASRAKTAFLATMSHEIRTPLNGVLGLAELAADRPVDEATRQEYLRLIVESGRSLAQVVSDVLDLSKIEAGKLEIVVIDFDLGAWSDGLRASFFALAEAKGLSLVVDAPVEQLGRVRGDALRMRQIAVNYLSNALRFTFQGQIRLRLRVLDGPRLRLEVQDTGVGIDPQDQARLFLPFEQASSGRTGFGGTGFGGTGLGLSICRELATLMKGAVGVDSAPGVGSTFWFEAPIERVSAEPSQEARLRDAAALKGRRILLADDNRVNQVVGAKILQRAGAVVDVVDDGLQAVKAVERAVQAGMPFDAILMDVQMPHMDGLEATVRIRSLPGGAALAIVAATAAVLQEDIDRALAQGMDDVVSKPFDAARLIDALSRSLERSGAQLAH